MTRGPQLKVVDRDPGEDAIHHLLRAYELPDGDPAKTNHLLAALVDSLLSVRWGLDRAAKSFGEVADEMRYRRTGE